MKPKRRKRGALSLPAIRRGEIERHAKHVGAAGTEDYWRWLVAWAWHNKQNIRDPAGALVMAAQRMGGRLTEAGAEAMLEMAETMPERRNARTFGKFLGITYEQRRQCGITTFGPRTPPAIKREQNRMTQETKRRAKGSQPREQYEANSFTRTKPWEARGISRRTWERRRKRERAVASPSAAIPPPSVASPPVASPSAAILSFVADAPASPERKKAGLPRGSLSEKRGGNSSTHSALREESVSVDDPGPAWCPHDVDEPSYTQREVDEAFEASCAGLEDKPWYGVKARP
jgi:hypothetical protein